MFHAMAVLNAFMTARPADTEEYKSGLPEPATRRCA